MSTVNKVILVGYISEEPLASSLSNKTKVVRFQLLTTELIKSNNHIREHIERHNIVMLEKLAECAEHELTSGLLLHIEGQVKTRSFIDGNVGVKRYFTEIVASEFNLMR